MKNANPVITKCAKTAGIRAGTIQGAMDGEFSSGLKSGDCAYVATPLSMYVRDPLLLVGLSRLALTRVASRALQRVEELEKQMAARSGPGPGEGGGE